MKKNLALPPVCIALVAIKLVVNACCWAQGAEPQCAGIGSFFGEGVSGCLGWFLTLSGKVQAAALCPKQSPATVSPCYLLCNDCGLSQIQ